jgi:hypothetical protein
MPQGERMLTALRNLIVYRFFGGRIMLGLALLGLARPAESCRRVSSIVMPLGRPS